MPWRTPSKADGKAKNSEQQVDVKVSGNLLYEDEVRKGGEWGGEKRCETRGRQQELTA
jgi:hypothetical protein